MRDTGVSGKLFIAIKALYNSVTSCVRINGSLTEWFEVNTGLRQGCSLSPVLFNLFINDLATKIKALDLGVDIGNGAKLGILLYADDVVFLAESEADYKLC